jgi:hypothetical protein
MWGSFLSELAKLVTAAEAKLGLEVQAFRNMRIEIP